MSSPIDRLPPEFVDRLQQVIPPAWHAGVFASFEQPKWAAFRVNRLRIPVAKALAGLREAGIEAEPVPWCREAFRVEPGLRSRLTHSPLVDSGEIYIQGLSSIFASLVLQPEPGEQVLDLAAAPGGKAAHMAAMMENRGWLSVVEPVRRRMFVLSETLRRAGVAIAHTYLMDGRRAGDKVPQRFDRVMLDAPCSGEARFHLSRPESWRTWSLRKIAEQSRKQRGLIRSAFQALRRGGRMLYSTCSFAPEENEAVVSSLISTFPDDARLEAFEMPFDGWQPGLDSFGQHRFDPQLALARRILPSERADGFFLALIAKQ
jgi:16S rRNA (cytosine1407-C5)-methyltransferase